jgi:hypothetical protein
MLNFDGHWHAGEVCLSRLNLGFKCTGKAVVDVNVVNRVPHGGGVVVLWAGISCGQQKQLHFMNGNLNAQRYRDKS